MFVSSVKIFLIVSMLLCTLQACHSSTKSETTNVAMEGRDSCLMNPAHSYELFIPDHEKSAHGLPLLVAIDPHGSGKTALDHLKEAAEKYPAVLVASNRIQNNDPNYIQELNELIADVQKRHPVGDRVYLAGFSGGARMALDYASNHPVAGVIACGAFANPQQLATIQCPVIGLIGMDDFNFSEVAQYLFTPENLPSNIHLELINASHQWPDGDRLTDSWRWFQLANESNKNISELGDYVQHQQKRIDSLTEAGDLLQAACIGRNMGSIQSFNTIVPFAENTNKLTSSASYKQQLKALAESLQFEMNTRQNLAQALFEKDENWWTHEISVLHEKAEIEPDVIPQMSYKRLIGFLGIICYSYSRQLAARGDISHLEQVLMVYRLAEPENPDMLHFTEELEKLQKP